MTKGKEISKHIEQLNNTVNQLDLIDVYTITHSILVEYTFFEHIWSTYDNLTWATRLTLTNWKE